MSAPILLSWSGGKDSALALHALQERGEHQVAGLLTTITEDYQRISMHGVRISLLRAQAEALGLPLREVYLSANGSNEDYEAALETAMLAAKSEGIHTVAFGDLFLEDVRAYREANLAKVDMTPLFPLWGRDTTQLARDFIALGFKAVLVCVDTQQLDAAFAGRAFDAQLLDDLPAGVDPCGENGEFHTFVYDGPIFERPVPVQTGRTVLREERFNFCDLLAAQPSEVAAE